MSTSKTVGCIFMVAGTALGAGMLALPMVAAGSGFVLSSLTLIFLCVLMCYTALLTLEVNIHFPVGTSFGTMAEKTLGQFGKWIVFIGMVLLFYSLNAAYISGAASLLNSVIHSYFHLNASPILMACIFTAVFGLVVYWKTQAVDYVNRVLFITKMAVLVIAISAMLIHVQPHLLLPTQAHPIFILVAIPIMFTSFGFHGSIPSILKYLGHHPKSLCTVFIIGSFIPLVIYLFWILVTLGVLPLVGNPSFTEIAKTHGSVGEFTMMLTRCFQNHWIMLAINLFSNIAVTTSFLGVSLGLFDYFYDNFKTRKRFKREGAAVLTFLPPLIFALLYPKGFIFALGFAAIALAVLAVLLPAGMVLSWRRQEAKRVTTEIHYRAPGGKGPIYFVFSIGCLIILLQLLTIWQVLPQFGL